MSVSDESNCNDDLTPEYVNRTLGINRIAFDARVDKLTRRLILNLRSHICNCYQYPIHFSEDHEHSEENRMAWIQLRMELTKRGFNVERMKTVYKENPYATTTIVISGEQKEGKEQQPETSGIQCILPPPTGFFPGIGDQPI